MEKIWVKHYEPGVPAEINPDAYHSLVDLFYSACGEYPEHTAVSNLGTALTYQELLAKARCFAAFLQQELKLKKGDKLAIMMPNCLQYPVVMFAGLMAGLTIVNVNPLYTAHELEHQMNDSGAKTVIVLANFARTVAKALKDTKIEHIIVTQLGDEFPYFKRQIINMVVKYIKRMIPEWNMPTALSYLDAMQIGETKEFIEVPIDNSELAFLQYTGGTTGVAKGAMLTHRNIIANVEQVASWGSQLMSLGEEVVITALPLYHIFSLQANLFVTLKKGGHIVLITNPRDIPAFIKILKTTAFTMFTGVNTLFNALVHHPDFKTVDFSSLKLSLGGGMAVQKAVAEEWFNITNTPLLEGYGLTETSPVVCINPFNATEYAGNIGFPVPSTDIAIRDADGQDLPQGEIGELCAKGPQVMQGYWNKPDETAAVLDDNGWVRTGDIATVNEQGFVKIVDRKKDMILVSGFNVYPNEVEQVIVSHPKVLEVGVVGVPSENSGEKVKAFVVRSDDSLTGEEVREFCREQLTAYKVPKVVEFKDELPKTNVGKILRRALRD